jgi:hypothetical protein
LADVALLEWLYIGAFHAQDATLLDNQTLNDMPSDTLGSISFKLHPSVRLMQSNWPVDTIWEENLKQQVTMINLESSEGCNLLIYRSELNVKVINLTIPCFQFLTALTNGDTIEKAWIHTLKENDKTGNAKLEDSELSSMLGYLLSLSIFTSAHVIADNLTETDDDK